MRSNIDGGAIGKNDRYSKKMQFPVFEPNSMV